MVYPSVASPGKALIVDSIVVVQKTEIIFFFHIIPSTLKMSVKSHSQIDAPPATDQLPFLQYLIEDS